MQVFLGAVLVLKQGQMLKRAFFPYGPFSVSWTVLKGSEGLMKGL